MPARKSALHDKDIEIIMGNLLRYGVLASVTIVVVGAFFYLFQHAGQKPQYRQFLGEPKRITEFGTVWKTALQGRGRSIIQIGLFVLMATPIARIVFSIIGYILEKDYLYIVITLIVLSVILLSL